jgi:hypothetical protein
MGKKISLAQAEEVLHKRYYKRYVKLTIPGYEPVHGRIDNIAIDTSKAPVIVLDVNDKRYTVSPECLKECIEFLKAG